MKDRKKLAGKFADSQFESLRTSVRRLEIALRNLDSVSPVTTDRFECIERFFPRGAFELDAS